jgi:hypothetical protein
MRNIFIDIQSHQAERKQVEKLQTMSKKNDDVGVSKTSTATPTDVSLQLVSAIEANMNCQVCMDLLMKPYGSA